MSNTTDNAGSIDALAHEIAYHAARSDIEVYCASERAYAHGEEPQRPWFKLDECNFDFDDGEEVARARKYLEARGLLDHHPEHASWVRIRDIEVNAAATEEVAP